MTTDTITAPAADLAGLLSAALDAGHAVSFTGEPEGYVAHVDVVRDEDTVQTYTGIADAPLEALAAAAAAAGMDVPGDGEPAGHVERLERNQRILIRALADVIAARGGADELSQMANSYADGYAAGIAAAAPDGEAAQAEPCVCGHAPAEHVGPSPDVENLRGGKMCDWVGCDCLKYRPRA